jgi:hypothetical protein
LHFHVQTFQLRTTSVQLRQIFATHRAMRRQAQDVAAQGGLQHPQEGSLAQRDTDAATALAKDGGGTPTATGSCSGHYMAQTLAE